MTIPIAPYASLPPIKVPVVAWPTNLYGCTHCDKPCVTGWKEATNDMRVRTSMSVGPPKTRRRFTLPMRTVKVTMNFAGYDFVELRAFFEGSGTGGTGGTEGGYKFFTFPHPYDGKTHYYRFLKPPQTSDDGPLRFNASMEWEEL
ncbi:MAG: hypothetical protein JRJ45_00515 [Deltaproteobacteria bacterium]|nr:hypothetical protein [Deltaproteobacteria bacterium]